MDAGGLSASTVLEDLCTQSLTRNRYERLSVPSCRPEPPAVPGAAPAVHGPEQAVRRRRVVVQVEQRRRQQRQAAEGQHAAGRVALHGACSTAAATTSVPRTVGFPLLLAGSGRWPRGRWLRWGRHHRRLYGAGGVQRREGGGRQPRPHGGVAQEGQQQRPEGQGGAHGV